MPTTTLYAKTGAEAGTVELPDGALRGARSTRPSCTRP